MCKRLFKIAAIGLTLMITVGCAKQPLRDSHVDIYKRIHEKYSRMTAYTAEVTLTVKGRKSEKVYRLTQQVQEPQKAVITVQEPESLKDVCTIFNGGQVLVKSPVSADTLLTKTEDLPNALLLNDFFSLYYQSEETAIHVDANEDSGTLLLETEYLPQTSEQFKTSLLLDTKTLQPKTITVFDAGGNVRMLAEFSDFCYNPPLAEELFDLTKQ